ncbi:MAG: chromate transporter [Lachnospiraceae bacterium]|uniref:Chromate transporter n=1 Tax=Candidatus Enterocloster excrementigallinarum TaxID=2838558 RepID=A0A9D2PSA6_9FIRM|nr:chromate transporter [Lachnospiraceae bacterium]HJC65494.1 chromate transporter [Candidatus Enterocloster excrementigallinarum]
MNLYLQLFISFLQIGALSFGGGYAAMPLIQQQVVTLHGWLSLSEFTDLITISQMTPGPIAINSATFVGTRVGGFWGALCATTGCVLPSCLLVSLLAWAYLKYGHLSIIQDVLSSLRPAVIAMIASAGFSILISILWPQGLSSLAALAQNVNLRGFLIFLGALVLLIRLRMNPILVMVLSGAAEVLCQLALRLIDV